ncbi:hypothetical protein BC830DRAFT_1136492 [Chytriomyces sp. MP71]|nr:hypothetical protein BC830DRAFT_1136492 [Chytriomyces sp. MP71]
MNPAGVAYADLNPLFFPLFASRLTASATLAKPDVFASFLNLTFPAAVPRPRLLQWADWILKDDFMIRREGVRDMTPFELVEALEERGYTRLSDLSLDAMREMLLAHSRFTKMLMDTIVSKRANETAVVYEDEYAVVPTVSSHLGLTPEELGGVATLLIFARALGVRG